MELRHLRGFIPLAEEQHFARVAQRLHIEQSPLSRAMKEREKRAGRPGLRLRCAQHPPHAHWKALSGSCPAGP